MIEEKMFGVFRHHRTVENIDLLRGFNYEYSVPHSRYFEVFLRCLSKNNIILTAIVTFHCQNVYKIE